MKSLVIEKDLEIIFNIQKLEIIFNWKRLGNHFKLEKLEIIFN